MSGRDLRSFVNAHRCSNFDTKLYNGTVCYFIRLVCFI